MASGTTVGGRSADAQRTVGGRLADALERGQPQAALPLKLGLPPGPSAITRRGEEETAPWFLVYLEYTRKLDLHRSL